jgi:hypothetical protein
MAAGLPGTGTVAHLEDDVAAALRLSPEDADALSASRRPPLLWVRG